MEVTFRPFELADLDACLAVFDSNVPRYFREEERSEFEAFLRELPGPYLVAEHASRIVGCGGFAIRPVDGVADLCWGMIHESHHGSGWGRGLTLRRVELARENEKVRSVELSTSQLTTGFYEGLGFQIVSVEPDGFSPGLDKCAMRAPVDGLGPTDTEGGA